MRILVLGFVVVVGCSGQVQGKSNGVECCPVSDDNSDSCNGIETGGTKGTDNCLTHTVYDGTPRSWVLTTDANGCPMWTWSTQYGGESCLTFWWPDVADTSDTIDATDTADSAPLSSTRTPTDTGIDTPADGPKMIVTDAGVTCCEIITAQACDQPPQIGGAPVNGTCPPGAWDVPPPWWVTTTDSFGCPVLTEDSSYLPTATCFPVPDTRPLFDTIDVAEAEAAMDTALDAPEMTWTEAGVECCSFSASLTDSCGGLWVGGTKSDSACSIVYLSPPAAWVQATDSNGCPQWQLVEPPYSGPTCSAIADASSDAAIDSAPDADAN